MTRKIIQKIKKLFQQPPTTLQEYTEYCQIGMFVKYFQDKGNTQKAKELIKKCH